MAYTDYEKGSLVGVKLRLAGILVGILALLGLGVSTASAQVGIERGPVKAYPPVPCGTPHIKGTGVRIRWQPAGRVIGAANPGEAVQYMSQSGGWTLLMFRWGYHPGMVFGWVSSEFVAWPISTCY
ncbi:hypothetical protein ACFQ1S_26860 [Kibdelosporangium lantanae]|uniref:SH3 domain-containing protein n=1 Tax=Kibdelosporangium lantanae TaxID=1497396 RepID=A0ABW3MH44_9PSEU